MLMPLQSILNMLGLNSADAVAKLFVGSQADVIFSLPSP